MSFNTQWGADFKTRRAGQIICRYKHAVAAGLQTELDGEQAHVNARVGSPRVFQRGTAFQPSQRLGCAQDLLVF